MSGTKLLGGVLLVLGILALIYRGFTYTQEEKILDIGPIEATTETQERVAVPIWVGALLVAGGAVLIAAGPKSRVS